MSKLLQKSGFNYDSAQLLIKNNYYAPSIHCYYYSCYQKLLHILYFILKKDEVFLTGLQRDPKNSKGSHEIAINEIVKAMSRNFRDGRTFSNTINELKKLRHDADYKNVEIHFDISNKASTKAAEIMEIFKNQFKV